MPSPLKKSSSQHHSPTFFLVPRVVFPIKNLLNPFSSPFSSLLPFLHTLSLPFPFFSHTLSVLPKHSPFFSPHVAFHIQKKNSPDSTTPFFNTLTHFFSYSISSSLSYSYLIYHFSIPNNFFFCPFSIYSTSSFTYSHYMCYQLYRKFPFNWAIQPWIGHMALVRIFALNWPIQGWIDHMALLRNFPLNWPIQGWIDHMVTVRNFPLNWAIQGWIDHMALLRNFPLNWAIQPWIGHMPMVRNFLFNQPLTLPMAPCTMSINLAGVGHMVQGYGGPQPMLNNVVCAQGSIIKFWEKHKKLEKMLQKWKF